MPTVSTESGCSFSVELPIFNTHSLARHSVNEFIYSLIHVLVAVKRKQMLRCLFLVSRLCCVCECSDYMDVYVCMYIFMSIRVWMCVLYVYARVYVRHCMFECTRVYECLWMFLSLCVGTKIFMQIRYKHNKFVIYTKISKECTVIYMHQMSIVISAVIPTWKIYSAIKWLFIYMIVCGTQKRFKCFALF